MGKNRPTNAASSQRINTPPMPTESDRQKCSQQNRRDAAQQSFDVTSGRRRSAEVDVQLTFHLQPSGPGLSNDDTAAQGAENSATSSSQVASAVGSLRGPVPCPGSRRASTLLESGAGSEPAKRHLCKLIDFGTAVGVREVGSKVSGISA